MDKHEEAAASGAPPAYAPPQTYPPQPQYSGGPQPAFYPGQPVAYPNNQPGMTQTQYQQGPGQPPLPPGGSWQQTPQGPVYVQQTTTVQNRGNVDAGTFNSLRTAIPELPMALAITCCVINCVLPGIGTIIAGFSVFCCGNPGQGGGERFGTFCINFWVGILQLFFVLFFIGWIWSIMWGVAFIAISDEGRRKREQSTTNTTTVVTTTVAPQPATYAQPPPHAAPQ